MKKTYFNPEIEVIKIETMQVLADSLKRGQGQDQVSSEDQFLAPEYLDEEQEEELDC